MDHENHWTYASVSQVRDKDKDKGPLDTREAKGWNCCFALPRVVSLGDDRQPVQKPVPELDKLHGEQETVRISAGAKVFKTKGDTVEIRVVFQQADKGTHQLTGWTGAWPQSACSTANAMFGLVVVLRSLQVKTASTRNSLKP